MKIKLKNKNKELWKLKPENRIFPKILFLKKQKNLINFFDILFIINFEYFTRNFKFLVSLAIQLLKEFTLYKLVHFRNSFLLKDSFLLKEHMGRDLSSFNFNFLFIKLIPY